MLRFSRIGLVVAACLAAAVLRLWGQAPAADPALADLDRRLQEAAVNGDAALLERHMADDFLFTHFGGSQDRKADWVERARQVPRPYLRRAVSEQAVESHGDVALVLGRLDVRVPARPQQGQPQPACYALRYAHVYARREGRWMFLSHHTMQMIDESHPCQ